MTLTNYWWLLIWVFVGGGALMILVPKQRELVNGKKVDIPSYQVKPGDVIAVKENSKEHPVIKASLEAINKRVEFITYDEKNMSATYVRYPERSELNPEINEALIVEFYNR